MSKDCGNHGEDDIRRTCRRFLAFLFFLALVVAVIALIVYLVLRPTHPRFYLQDASLRQLDVLTANASAAAGVLSTVLQVTVASRNPKYQQITLASALPPVYQGHGDVEVWSPVLSGPNVPFAPYLADALAKDVQARYLILQVKIDGRVRWKVGSWISGHYHIFVTCPAFLIGTGGNGAPGANGLRFQTATYCHVEV
ncbi:unnamed protein product [Triticum turgidum subsp. durum]|uniref:Late embryogenesis abundant protein LEA-2 subgroup domain-containing protein n=1 Tax=Triticum turgidum subsp. durum TaxID=4567 RepID=A0A9R0SYA1_TRITD|nr:unnamed protein product [Triticum turgidum subsp. durum]